MTTTDQPRRKDAARNRLLLLETAKRVFAQRGVGVGTIYRHFPDKNLLIDAVFEAQVETMIALLEQALADPDPWASIVWFHEKSLELQANDRGLKELMQGMPGAP